MIAAIASVPPVPQPKYKPVLLERLYHDSNFGQIEASVDKGELPEELREHYEHYELRMAGTPQAAAALASSRATMADPLMVAGAGAVAASSSGANPLAPLAARAPAGPPAGSFSAGMLKAMEERNRKNAAAAAAGPASTQFKKPRIVSSPPAAETVGARGGRGRRRCAHEWTDQAGRGQGELWLAHHFHVHLVLLRAGHF
jgi:hypothetical protein